MIPNHLSIYLLSGQDQEGGNLRYAARAHHHHPRLCGGLGAGSPVANLVSVTLRFVLIIEAVSCDTALKR